MFSDPNMLDVGVLRGMRHTSFLCKYVYLPHRMRSIMHRIHQRMTAGSEHLKISPCPFDWYVLDDASGTVRTLVVRGSSYGVDHWKINLDYDPVSWFDTFQTHRGTLRTVKGLLKQTAPLFRSRSVRYRFAGHSSGGNIALLAALELVRNGTIYPSQIETVDSYGAPAILAGPTSTLLTDLGMVESQVRNIAMNFDLVPRLLSNDYSMLPVPMRKLFLKGNVPRYDFVGQMFVIQPDPDWHDFCTYGHHPHLSGEPGVYAVRTCDALNSFLAEPHPVNLIRNWDTVIDYHNMENTYTAIRRIIHLMERA